MGKFIMEYTDPDYLKNLLINRDFLQNFYECKLKMVKNSIEEAEINVDMGSIDRYFQPRMRWIVRIVFFSIGFQKQKATFRNKILGLLSKYGLVHIGIQIGPYLIDWVDSSELRIRPLSSKNIMLALYYSFNSSVDPYGNDFRNTVNKIIDIRRETYNELSNNCYQIVDRLSRELNVPKKWIKNGPIRNFVENFKTGDCYIDNYTLNFFSEPTVITNHNQLIEYWENNKTKVSDMESSVGLEIIDLIRSIERGYMCRGEVDENSRIQFDEKLNEEKFRNAGGITLGTMYSDDTNLINNV